MIYPYPNSLIDRVADSARGRVRKPFAGLLGPERTFRLVRVDLKDFGLRHVKRPDHLVIADSRVDDLSVLVNWLILAIAVPPGPHYSALKLALNPYRVDDLAAVMGGHTV